MTDTREDLIYARARASMERWHAEGGVEEAIAQSKKLDRANEIADRTLSVLALVAVVLLSLGMVAGLVWSSFADITDCRVNHVQSACDYINGR